jgi:hypothetical protein
VKGRNRQHSLPRAQDFPGRVDDDPAPCSAPLLRPRHVGLVSPKQQAGKIESRTTQGMQMQGLTAAYALGSIALMVIGGVMILRKAFSSNIWWGLGCLLLPVIAPAFVFLNWREARKGFLILVTGVVVWGGVYLSAREKANQAVADIKIIKIAVTTALSDTYLPVSDLERISRNEKRVFLFVRMQVPPSHLYRFTGQIYDQSGKIVLDRTTASFPDGPVWNTWFYHSFDKVRDTPGQWRFVFFASDKQLAEQRFEVTEDDSDVKAR